MFFSDIPSSSVPSEPDVWFYYLEKTKKAEGPRDTLKKALEILTNKDKSPGFAVDLGAGTGRDTLYLLNSHWEVLAIDFSQHAVDILTERAKNLK
jgi:tellurite methyltransferase